MARFLNTSATNYFLEELIKGSTERLILISPFLKFNDRIKEFLTDKDRLKIDVRVVYGKTKLRPEEMKWLSGLEFVRTSFCPNLHAKCYISETEAIVTSMNLYDFSQVNNNEMGVHFDREKDSSLYREIYEEAQRLLRVSDPVRLSAEVDAGTSDTPHTSLGDPKTPSDTEAKAKISTSKFAKKHSMSSAKMFEKLIAAGLLQKDGKKSVLTEKGRLAGGAEMNSTRFGDYVVWPEDMEVDVA